MTLALATWAHLRQLSPGDDIASVHRIFDVEFEPHIRALVSGSIKLLQTSQGEIAEDAEEGSQSTNHAALVVKTAGAVALLIAIAAGWFTSTGFVRRLGKLQASIVRVGAGELDVRAEPGPDDEIGQLANAFNAMAAQLQAQRDELVTKDELKVQKDRAEAANRAKSAFLANMSHEIRTPMTAILGFADVLMAERQIEEQRVECVRTIRRNGEHLLSVINDILDLSKIEADRMTVERVACGLCQIVAEVAALMRPRAIGKGVALDVQYIFPVPATIQSDPIRLRQILINLVGNAVKFTEAGSVQIVVRSDGLTAADPYVHIEVIDTGMGMGPEQLSRLFTPFIQGDASTTRKFGGTGLGLAISHRLAQMMNGQLTADSTAGKGSRFSLRLKTGSLTGIPMITNAREALAEPDSNAAPELKAVLSGRVLLAEDGPDNRQLIGHHLRKSGAEIVFAENGRIACERAKEALIEGRPFGLILMDMQMPEMDGYEATSSLRREGYRGAIVALTAHAMDSDREKCLAAGCDDYLSKPIDRRRLLETVQHFFELDRAPLAMSA